MTLTVATVYAGSADLPIAEVSSIEPVLSSNDYTLKLPDFNEIYTLAKQTQEATDALSRFLNDTKLSAGLCNEHRLLLESTVNHFCTFCRDAEALLRTFSKFSRRFAAIFASVVNQECYSDIKRCATVLLSDIKTVSSRISSVEQHCMTFTVRFREWMLVAPVHHSHQDIIKDHQIFQRLDVFWKVIVGQLSGVLDDNSKGPHPGISGDVRNTWLEYEGCLLGAIDSLKLSSDTLKVSVDGLRTSHQKNGITLSGYVKKGFTAFWSKLSQPLLRVR